MEAAISSENNRAREPASKAVFGTLVRLWVGGLCPSVECPWDMVVAPRPQAEVS